MSIADKLAFEGKVKNLFDKHGSGCSVARPRSLRDELSTGRVLVWVDDTNEPLVGLWTHVAPHAGERTGVFGRTLGFTLPGELTIKRTACRLVHWKITAIASVINDLTARRVWWEQETTDAVSNAAARMCGFRLVGTKAPGVDAWFRGEDRSIAGGSREGDDRARLIIPPHDFRLVPKEGLSL